MRLIKHLALAVTIAIGLLGNNLTAQGQSGMTAASPESAFSISKQSLLQPEQVQPLLQENGARKPVILQVGSHVLFAEAHIPGAIYAGPGAESGGLQALQGKVASLPKDRPILIYCGCCPWNHCPNIGPAYHKLEEMGFSNLKVIYLADNFGKNWVDKGYPVERGR